MKPTEREELLQALKTRFPKNSAVNLFQRCLKYFSSLGTAKIVLWCYLIWYLVTVVNHFDPSPAIWLNSLGISAVIGVALVLSVGGQALRIADRWQTIRLFLMPFCVSSFSSLIKGHGFVLIVPPNRSEQLVSFGACAAFLLVVMLLKRINRVVHAQPGAPVDGLASADDSSLSSLSRH
ncbi:MAG: hypothetical protein ABI606_10320 [Rhodoferax sp.]